MKRVRFGVYKDLERRFQNRDLDEKDQRQLANLKALQEQANLEKKLSQK